MAHKTNMKSDKMLRVGVIGVGNIGAVHVETIYTGQVKGMVLTAICDIHSEKREMLLKKYPEIEMFSTYEELITSGTVDAVIISTPHYAHPEIAVCAFQNGLHVLCEKPAGVYTAAVKEMIAAAKESGKVFSVMFNQRTNKLFGKAHELMQSGSLGELKRVVWIITNWYRKQAYYDSGKWRGSWRGEGGGVLINQAPHNLDLWQWICGMPVSLAAECSIGKYHRITVEDEAIIKAHYENGATALFITSTGDYPGTNRLEIDCTKGKMVLEQGKLTLSVCERDEREFRLEPSGVKNPVTVTEYTDEESNGHLLILQNFADAVNHGMPLIAPGEEAIYELELSNAAYLSSWLGKEIPLPVDCELFEEFLEEKQKHETQMKPDSEETMMCSSYIKRWETNW